MSKIQRAIIALALLATCGLLAAAGKAPAVRAQSGPVLAGALLGPRESAPPLALSRPAQSAPQATQLKAVVIAGDVGASNASFQTDMDLAVQALEDGGVAVTQFYYGETSFGWADIVTATQGAHFLLYTGHGVYWTSGDLREVGGFYLGDGQFVSPDQIRSDLAGVMAADSVVILSHACFSAGDSADDPAPISQEEAARRVGMYADPFVDIGVDGYFANNYYTSAKRTVEQILAGKNMGDVFKAGVGYNSARLVDLSYGEPGYDLWLDGEPGSWDLGLVAQTDFVLEVDEPEVAPLPDEVTFMYSIPDQRLVPEWRQITPTNIGNDETLSWSLAISGTWVGASPLTGSTPQEITLAPSGFVTDTARVHSGAITVTVTSPAGVKSSPQRIDVIVTTIDAPVYDTYLPLTLKDWRP